ncbi:transposase family protein [Desulfovibrio sp. OttesenSCG-928-G15]|nr:transposase family protein [Desulfovibrio sp. OttesenSCG-928-G15]
MDAQTRSELLIALARCGAPEPKKIPAEPAATENAPAVITPEYAATVFPVVKTRPRAMEPVGGSLEGYTDNQRKIAEARLAIVRHVQVLADMHGKEAAVQEVVKAAKDGALPPHLQALVPVANAKFGQGTKKTGLSRDPLYKWMRGLKEKGMPGLAPGIRQADMSIPVWAPLFLKYYQRPQRPSIKQAYSEFYAEYVISAATQAPPSYDAVKRFVHKMAVQAAQTGRVTGNAMLKLKAHKLRSTKDLYPGDVYTADGTTFDAEIQHPQHGRPFKPEVTLIVDVATRRCVGLSLCWAENSMTVLDALRMACLYGGIPSMFYTDNGPGYRNAFLAGPSVGMCTRLGIEITHSIPGRPQGKGLMERAVQTICEPAAKKFRSCMHADMDPDTGKKVFKISRAQIKKHGSSPLLPTWADFCETMLERVQEYNSTPHRALPKHTDLETGKLRHMSPDEYWRRFEESGKWEPVRVTADVSEDLWMPSEVRKAHNGMIEFYNGKYYSAALEEFHGERVEVRYDIWDSSKVFIHKIHGPRICVAKLDGNTIPYFPASRLEAARANRQKAQLIRLERKAQEIAPGATLSLPESEPAFTIADAFTAPVREKEPVLADSHTVEIETTAKPLTPKIDRRPVFMDAYKKYEWLMTHKDQQTASDAAWLAEYATTEEYEAYADMYEHKGIAYMPQHATAEQK